MWFSLRTRHLSTNAEVSFASCVKLFGDLHKVIGLI